MAHVMHKLIYEVLDAASKATSKADKIKILKAAETPALKDVLQATYDDIVVFTLPGGTPPYTPNQEGSIPSSLLKQHMKFKFFVKGLAGDNLKVMKRERMFIDMLEAVHPKDAEVLIKMINKESLGKGITKKLVQEAYPGLIVK
tara:strand:+ start:923 stop:1354 length:432 start_codon:yes stop_codon:yes gene_type:complete